MVFLKKYSTHILLLIMLIGLVVYKNYSPQPIHTQGEYKTNDHTALTPQTGHANLKNDGQVPEYALKVLKYIQQNHEAPEGYVGSRIFQNRERRLKQKNAQGERISYQEWDVHPKKRGENRGPERLVTGDDGTSWYTPDHYNSFIEIKN